MCPPRRSRPPLRGQGVLQQERRDQVRGGRRPRQQDVVGASDPASHCRGPEGKADLHRVRINCVVVRTVAIFVITGIVESYRVCYNQPKLSYM